MHQTGRGEPDINSGERGDLLAEAAVSQHPTFECQDTSIYSTVPISFVRAVLGGPVRIRAIDGKMEYEMRPRTQTDTKVRLKEKGVPSPHSRNIHRDRYVTLVVQVPEHMSQAQKEALGRSGDVTNGTTSSEREEPKKRGTFE